MQAAEQAPHCLNNGVLELSFMECLEEDNYFGKLLGPHTDAVLKVMRFSQVLANPGIQTEEFTRILQGGLDSLKLNLKNRNK